MSFQAAMREISFLNSGRSYKQDAAHFVFLAEKQTIPPEGHCLGIVFSALACLLTVNTRLKFS